MAKRKIKGKEVGVKGAKEAAKLAGKKTTAHKPTEAKAKPKTETKPKAKPKSKAKSKLKAKSKAKPKAKSNLPFDIEYPLAQIDKPADGPKEVDIGKPETEISTGKVEDLQTDDQQEDVNEALIEDTDTTESRIETAVDFQTDNQTDGVIEVAEETEKLAEEVESLQAEDEQTGIAVEAECPDLAESPSRKKVEDTQTDKPVDDVSESAIEDTVVAINLTETIDDTKTDEQPGDVNEALIEDSDIIESRIDDADDIQTDSQTDEVIEVAEETEQLADEVESLQVEDEQASIVVEAEDSDLAESPSQKMEEDTQTDTPVDDAPESVIEDTVVAINLTETIDDTKTDDQPGDVNEALVEDSDIIESRIDEAGGTQTDNQSVSSTEADVEGTDDEIQTAVYSDKKPYRAKKTGIIISVFIVIAAVVLLIFASIERRSAKKTIVQISKIAGSIRQMQEEALKDREQVTHSQIESRDLVIDALSLTRNGLELERAHSDEVEVKRIIDVFISDIDERITKIKDDIALLRNKMRETD